MCSSFIQQKQQGHVFLSYLRITLMCDVLRLYLSMGVLLVTECEEWRLGPKVLGNGISHNPSCGFLVPCRMTSLFLTANKWSFVNIILHSLLQSWPSESKEELFRPGRTVVCWALSERCEDSWRVPVCVGRIISLSGRVTGAPCCLQRVWRQAWSSTRMKWLVAPLSPLAMMVGEAGEHGGGTSEEVVVWFNLSLICFNRIIHAFLTSSSVPRPYSVVAGMQ